MKKLFTSLALTALLIAPTFANVEGTIQGDVMLTNLETNATPVYDGTSNNTQGDVMPINSVLDGTTDTIQNDVMLISSQSKTIEFYRDGKTPKIYSSLENLLKGEKNVTTVTDGCNNGFVVGTGAAMTMMYCDNIYGKEGKEIWQRTDTKITISGDNTNYFNEKLFKSLDRNSKLKEKYYTLLSKLSEEKLQAGLENADKLINTTKLSRIAKEMQDRKITMLYFVKTLINDQLISK